MFAENLVGLSFLYSISYIKSISTHKKIVAAGKSGPNATLNLFCLGVGLALGWGARRFHNNIICLPTQHNSVNRKNLDISVCGLLSALKRTSSTIADNSLSAFKKQTYQVRNLLGTCVHDIK